MNRLKQSLSSMSTPSLPSFGSGQVSPSSQVPPPLEPRERLVELAARRRLSSGLLQAYALLHRSLAKEKTDPRSMIGHGKTQPPVAWVAGIMTDGAEELRDCASSTSNGALEDYARVASTVGELHAQLAQLSGGYHAELAANVLAVLERRAVDFKEYEQVLKEAEKKRSVLDAVMTKIDKGKKDPAEYELDLDAAQAGYTEVRQRLQRRADQLDESLAEDTQAAREMVAVQLGESERSHFARSYVALLEDCHGGLTATSKSRGQSASATRMTRAQSDSSGTGAAPVITPTIYSVLDHGRSRANTVSSVTSDSKDRDGAGAVSPKNRSRSGSVLDRFAFGGRAKKKDAIGEGDETRSPSSSRNPSSPSRFNASLPTLPTLGSFKKLSVQSDVAGGKYSALGDTEEYYNTAPPSPTRSPNTKSGSHPPAFRRSQTAPDNPSSSATSLSFSPTSPSFRQVPPLPSRPTKAGPVGRTYRAQWPYTPTGASHGDLTDEEDDASDLELERGTLVRIEEEITPDWWRGVVVAGARQGRRGMLPSAYVVAHEVDRAETSTLNSNASTTEETWRALAADDGASSAPETSSDGHGFDHDDEDGDGGLLPEFKAPSWSFGNGEDDAESPFGDDQMENPR
ncbi:hypothetical protein JCM8202v2_005738 [Rhodotorula sphaerocarpa]